MTDRPLTVTVHAEDGTLWAQVTELPGVFATGDTMDELNDDLAAALTLYFSEPGSEVSVQLSVTSEQVQLATT